ncbi:MAG: hypothetical protein NT175_03455 [Bacteroidetes bacterium]|nr:hypothetical protein [Bacteroidota bacterium]
MKTRELRDFYRILSELNNSFTHYSFVWNQFCIDYFEMIDKKPETLTQDYFVSNPFKRKHNIKLKELEKEHAKTDATLIQGIFLLIYSHFESYLKNILDFSQQVDENIKSFDKKLEEVESDSLLFDKMLNRLAIDKIDFIAELIDTLDYLRLKRNRLTHQNSVNISNSLNQLIKTKGQRINEFWDSKLSHPRQGIDFANKQNANMLNFSIIIDSINILRRIVLEIDSKIVSKLTTRKIVEKIMIPDFKKEQQSKINHNNQDRIISKFKRYCVLEFGLEPDKEMIEQLISSIA